MYTLPGIYVIVGRFLHDANKWGFHFWIYLTSSKVWKNLLHELSHFLFWTTRVSEIYLASSGRWRWLKVTLSWEATPGEESVVTAAPVTIRIQKWPCQCQLWSQERWCQAGWSLGQDTWQAYQRSNNIWNTLTAVEGDEARTLSPILKSFKANTHT